MADGKHEQGENLKDIFDDIRGHYTTIEDTSEPTNSVTVQDKVKNAITLCQKAIFMVNKLRLFSDNEEIEEVATNELRYMLLSAFLGYFTLKHTTDDRVEIVKQGEHYFKDYLRLCQSYSVCDRLIPSLEEPEEPVKGDNSVRLSRPPDLNAMNRTREAKIRRYKEKQAADKRVRELSEAVEKSHVEEEVKREYYLALLNQWVHTSIDELESIKDELPILEHMAKLKIGDACAAGGKVDQRPKQPFRPFILTKNNLQKQVFGLGYPAVPTMTVEEFYEKKVADGTFQLHGESMQDWAMNPEKTAAAVEQEDVEKEEKIERDDPVTIIRERNWDEWKDDHRRGWGNRQNMG